MLGCDWQSKYVNILRMWSLKKKRKRKETEKSHLMSGKCLLIHVDVRVIIACQEAYAFNRGGRCLMESRGQGM